ncbi:MAG TPA: RdgB/HAM1 family non-canonical purine NTP pyrophosphatase [Anaerolineales bacterium]
MKRLLVATNNPGKLREMLSLLEDMHLAIVTPEDIGIQLEPEENGSTYEENASLKARAFAQASGLVTMADDSGLEVDALMGSPGIRSARFSPLPHATDADRRVYLLGLLRDYPPPWKAHFHCTVAIATPQDEIYFAQGDCPGMIIAQERGTNGFGYDPIFLLEETGLTMAELPMDKKNRLSHRARAVKAAIPTLMKIYQRP